MKEIKLETKIRIYPLVELPDEELPLMQAAVKATEQSYAPYSKFHVGAAALLANGTIVTGSNQENAAYPSGLCAERTTLFYAGAHYPDAAVQVLAIAAMKDGERVDLITPCGACRQVMLETEQRYNKPMKVLLCGKDALPTESTPLLSFTFTPRPGQKRELEIRLPDELGKELLTDLIAEEDYFDSQDKFKEKFPGLALVAESNGGCIIGFLVNESSMAITLHYKEITSQRTEKELIFSVNTDYAYTGIRHDRTGTSLATLESGIENLIHSYDLDKHAYMQGLTGLYNQIEFPYLNNLQDAGEIVSIESATLYLYPQAGSYNKLNQLPEDIRLYITDENNVLEDYVYGSDGVTVQTGNLSVDEMFGRDTYYSFNVTEFIRNNFGTWGIKRQKLLLSLPDNEMITTFNQIIFANDPDQERQCRLDIRFKIYNEK